MLFLAWRWPLVLLAGSIALWAVTSRYGLNFPSYPNPAGWFFNPLAWQLLFTIGLLTGTAMKDGRRLVPVTPWLLVPAGAVLVLGLDLWVGGPWSGAIWDWQWQTLQAGTPEMLVGVEKTFLPLPRLIHALSLAYILSVVLCGDPPSLRQPRCQALRASGPQCACGFCHRKCAQLRHATGPGKNWRRFCP